MLDGAAKLSIGQRLAACVPVALLCLVTLALGACSSVASLNARVPRTGYSLHADQPYATGPAQTLDIYVPDGLKAPAPIIIFFHGGGWQTRLGAKKDYLFAAQGLVARGYVVVTPAYRQWPDVVFPAFVEDGATAVAWVFAHGASYGGDLSRVYVMGHSAGAHIAALLALDGHYLANRGIDRSRLAGLIGLAGAYDFLPIEGVTFKMIFDTANQDPALSQPISFVTPGAPPALLATGDDDTVVLPRNSVSLARRLAASGNKVVLKHYPGLGHDDIVLALSPALTPGLPPLLDEIDTFIRGNAAQP